MKTAERLSEYNKRIAEIDFEKFPIIFAQHIEFIEVERGKKRPFYKEGLVGVSDRTVGMFEDLLGIPDPKVALYSEHGKPMRVCKVQVLSKHPYVELELLEKMFDIK